MCGSSVWSVVFSLVYQVIIARPAKDAGQQINNRLHFVNIKQVGL